VYATAGKERPVNATALEKRALGYSQLKRGTRGKTGDDKGKREQLVII
jgi:hypothetical protein